MASAELSRRGVLLPDPADPQALTLDDNGASDVELAPPEPEDALAVPGLLQ